MRERAFLHDAASAAYQSYLRGYAALPKAVRKLVHVGQLHLGHLARSFGLKEPPSSFSQQQAKRKANARAGGATRTTEYLAGAEYLPRAMRDDAKPLAKKGQAQRRGGGARRLEERMRGQKRARPVGGSAFEVSEFG